MAAGSAYGNMESVVPFFLMELRAGRGFAWPVRDQKGSVQEHGAVKGMV